MIVRALKRFPVGVAIAAALVLLFSTGYGHVSAQSGTAPVEDDEITAVVNSLQKQIEAKRQQIDGLKDQIGRYQKAIEVKRQEANTIEGEISLLDNKIAKTELDIRANELEIDSTNLELKELNSQIQEKTLRIMKQRQMIAEFIRQIAKSDQKTAIDLFLTQETISDFFNDVRFLEESQRELKSALDTVKALKADLEERETAAKAKRDHLVDIQAQLAKSKDELGEAKTAQAILADEARQTEVRYRYELAQLKREVDNMNSDIAEAERKLRKTLDAQRLRQISGAAGDWGWPVDPVRGITAYFHDPEYPFRYVFEHPAIDIRVSQGTPVRAAKGGYVARARDAGMGYNYVMLVHDGDFATVYGHLSRITVAEDTYVEKGEIVGYSGGLPGTPGAGKLSTGAHLHFEVRRGGIPVDPLSYLKL